MKTVFITAIMLCSAGIGYGLYKWIKESLDYASLVFDFMIFTKQKITYHNAPLTEIYSDFSKENRKLLQKFDNRKSELQPNDPPIKLSDSISEKLPKEAKIILSDFENDLGKTNKSEQLKIMDYHIERYERGLDKLKEELPKKAKLYLSLCLTSGILIIILFI